MPQRQQVLDKWKEVSAKALALYGVDLSVVTVSFNLRGVASGMAHVRGWNTAHPTYKVRFNYDMLTREAFEHVMKETVPHEAAHIICWMRPELGKNHDEGWKRVFMALGGSGKTRHFEDIVRGRGLTYQYTSTTGVKHSVSEMMHRKLQSDPANTLRWPKNGGTIDMFCAHRITGKDGRSFETPLREVAARERPSKAAGRPYVENTMAVAPAQIRVPALQGASKAAQARSIMLATKGQDIEAVITAIQAATGHSRQLARATYKANAARVGIIL